MNNVRAGYQVHDCMHGMVEKSLLPARSRVGFLASKRARPSFGAGHATSVLADLGRLDAAGEARLLHLTAVGLAGRRAPAHVGARRSFRGQAGFAPAVVDTPCFRHGRGQHGGAEDNGNDDGDQYLECVSSHEMRGDGIL